MRGARRWWRHGWLWCWSALCGVCALRPFRPNAGELRRADFRSQTRLLGVRMDGRIRDRLRATWLRIARPD